ncbi:MAG: aspartate aminotransferase family protein [Dethiobacteria bacterium]|jgi:acetylornithine/N-succinyldiaminopimelate aminotransferase
MSVLKGFKQKEQRYIINTYNRNPEKTLLLVEGEGAVVRDEEGREYLDFLGGLAVTALGHCHPRVTAAIREQAGKLVHTSNLYYTLPQTELAELLVENSCGDKVFFANSGAEVNEAAIKLARKYAQTVLGEKRYEIITAYRSFHGRTLATLTATGQEKFRRGFDPLPEGFVYATFNDLDSFAAAVTEKTCAIMVEVVQAEGGVYVAEQEFLRGLRRLCDEQGLLLIFDEVQCGMGRTGRLWAYEHYGVEPDIFTVAKALANGLPIGAMVAKNKAAEGFGPGDHASTFGGNPVASAAAVATLQTIFEDNLLAHVQERGQQILQGYERLRQSFPGLIKEYRGRGLIIGLEFTKEIAPQIQQGLVEEGFLVNAIGGSILRCLPPYIVTEKQVNSYLEALEKVIVAFQGGK